MLSVLNILKSNEEIHMVKFAVYRDNIKFITNWKPLQLKLHSLYYIRIQYIEYLYQHELCMIRSAVQNTILMQELSVVFFFNSII